MTLEELKNEYLAKAEKFHNEGLEASRRAERYEGYADLYSPDDSKHIVNLETAMSERRKAIDLFNMSTIYASVVSDLLKVTK